MLSVAAALVVVFVFDVCSLSAEEEEDVVVEEEDNDSSISGHSFANMAGALALNHVNIFSSSCKLCLRGGIASAILFIFPAICISRLYPVTSALSTIVSSTDCISSCSAEVIEGCITFLRESGGIAIGNCPFSCIGDPPSFVISCLSLS